MAICVKPKTSPTLPSDQFLCPRSRSGRRLVYGLYLAMTAIAEAWASRQPVLQCPEEALSLGYRLPRISRKPLFKGCRVCDSIHVVVCAYFTSHGVPLVCDSIQWSLNNVHVYSLVRDHTIIPSHSPNSRPHHLGPLQHFRVPDDMYYFPRVIPMVRLNEDPGLLERLRHRKRKKKNEAILNELVVASDIQSV